MRKKKHYNAGCAMGSILTKIKICVLRNIFVNKYIKNDKICKEKH